MSFLYPGFLFALLAVGIPLLIHLFRFRRVKTIYFPNLRFLQQLRQEHRSHSKIKHLIILLLRMLAIVLLVLAFARPTIDGVTQDDEGSLVAVYVDNSFSMEASSARGRLLDEAVVAAAQIVQSHPITDRFMLVTSDFEGRHQRFADRDAFLSMLQEVEVSPSVATMDDVLDRISGHFSDETGQNNVLYVLSDFQKSSSLPESFESELSVFFLPLQSGHPDNLFIDSCWVESPLRLKGEPLTLMVRVTNQGSMDLENQPLRLYIEGVQRSLTSFDLEAGESLDMELTWTAGDGDYEQGYVEISDYPVTFDDKMYFSLRLSHSLPVMAIEGLGRNSFLHALFSDNDLFDYQTMPSAMVDYSAFSGRDFIILDGLREISTGLGSALKDFVDRGGSLAVFPGPDMDVSSYERFAQTMSLDAYLPLDTTAMRTVDLNAQHPLFDEVFDALPEQLGLPFVNQYHPIPSHGRSLGDPLMRLQNRSPLLISYPSGEGKVLLSAVGLQDGYGNLPRHALFVPVMVNMAFQAGRLQPLYHIAGDDKPLRLRDQRVRTDQVYLLKKDGFEVIPDQRRVGHQVHLFLHQQLSEAGHYDLFLEGSLVGQRSFNYDRRESLMEFFTMEELRQWMSVIVVEEAGLMDVSGNETLGQILEKRTGTIPLWRYFLIAAICCLLAEVVLLRFWK